MCADSARMIENNYTSMKDPERLKQLAKAKEERNQKLKLDKEKKEKDKLTKEQEKREQDRQKRMNLADKLYPKVKNIPHINHNTDHQSDGDILQSMKEREQMHKQKWKTKMDKIKKEREEKDDPELTFKPNINHDSQLREEQSPQTRQKIIESTMVRMDRYEKIRQENRKKVDESIKSQYPFKPSLQAKQHKGAAENRAQSPPKKNVNYIYSEPKRLERTSATPN